MTTLLSTTTFTLSLLLPATAPQPFGTYSLTPSERAALIACVERAPASLAGLRAGGANAPEALRSTERAALAVAESQSAALAALRGGSEPSNNEWKWLAIGAGIVLLVILI
jgi:drug/metabolite transporter (DMT)-like permease